VVTDVPPALLVPEELPPEDPLGLPAPELPSLQAETTIAASEASPATL
jgi:hypothetical protein